MAKGWPLDLSLRDRSFNYLNNRKDLTIGTHIEVDNYYHSKCFHIFCCKGQHH